MATLWCVLVLLLAAETGSEAQCSGSTSRVEFTVTSVKNGTTHRDVAASLRSEVPADSQEPQPVALKVAHWTQRCDGTETVAMDISTASSILAESGQNSTVTSVSYGDDKPPKITKPKSDALIIEANEDIDLSCESNELVNWTCPYYEDDEEIVTIATKELSPTHYVSHLQRKKAKYYHTGNYSCWKVGKEHSLTKVYVYVRDDEYPFAAMEEHLVHLAVPRNQTAVFDCRPNAPDIEVEFTNSAEEVCKLGRSTDGTVLEYNERTGFTLHHVNDKHGGMYFCRADGTVRTFLLTVMAASDSVARPVITSDHQHSVVGDNVTLSCEVTVDVGITFTLAWDVPPTSPAQKEGRVLVGRPAILSGHKDGGETGAGNLTIYNIQDVDNGTYVCKVEDHAGNRNNVTFDLAVYASEPPAEL